MLIPKDIDISDDFNYPLNRSMNKGNYLKYLDYLVLSEHNKQYLVSLLFKIFAHRLNKANTPMASKLLTALDKALVHYDIYITEDRDIRGNLSYINACLIIDVKKEIDSSNIKDGYDPLWVHKGPCFKKELINIDTKQGSRWPIDQSKKKTFEMEPRFRSSQMYWYRPNFTKNYYGTDGK